MLPIGKMSGNRGERRYTPAGAVLLKNATEEARSAGGTIVTTTHLALAAPVSGAEVPYWVFHEAAGSIPELVAAARANLADGAHRGLEVKRTKSASAQPASAIQAMPSQSTGGKRSLESGRIASPLRRSPLGPGATGS